MIETMTFKEKLLELQKRIGPIKKDAKNPFFKNKYADLNSILAEIKPILQELKLILKQNFLSHDNIFFCETTIEDGESQSHELYEIPIGLSTATMTPQQYGSLISYGRRYSIVNALNLEMTDDDGNEANESKKLQKKNEVDYKSKILSRAGEIKNKLTAQVIKYFTDLKNSTNEYTKEMFDRDSKNLEKVENGKPANEPQPELPSDDDNIPF